MSKQEVYIVGSCVSVNCGMASSHPTPPPPLEQQARRPLLLPPPNLLNPASFVAAQLSHFLFFFNPCFMK